MQLAINALFWDRPHVGSGQYLRYLVPSLLVADPTLRLSLISCRPLDLPPQLASHPRLTSLHVPTPFGNQDGNLAKLWFEQIGFPRACRTADIALVPYFGSPRLPTIPTVVTIHDLIPMVVPAYCGGPHVRLYTALVASAARRASQIMADSEASRRDILRQLTVDSSRVHTVYLAPAPDFRPPSPAEITAVRQKYSLPDRFILYFGGYDVRKNVPTLIRAYQQAKEQLSGHYPLVLAGGLPQQDTPFFPDPRPIADDLGVELITCGWIDEADRAGLYGAASVYVFPSWYEGFGLTILEAMACGTPVITSKATSLPELAGDAALLCDPHQPMQLAQAMVRLCQDEGLRAQCIEQGFAQVQQFSWQKTADEVLRLLRQTGL